ncbi:HPr family phosphocarrier protein [Desulfococcaceae bacterium OttesenSCG-928-F15]|nr:HPr family phosphocarrier protein [Desulfococcaceae bacterium OttesenSCG-928-F15]
MISEHQRKLTIKNILGIHARPAAAIAKIAQTAKSGIWIEREEERVDATSMIDLLSLACRQGQEIFVCIDNAEDLAILDDIALLVENGFGE